MATLKSEVVTSCNEYRSNYAAYAERIADLHRRRAAAVLGGPQLVYAATREEVGIEPLGGGDMHSRFSGVTDHLAENDSRAIAITREIVANRGEVAPQQWTVAPVCPPRLDPNEIYGIISANPRIPGG